MGRLYLGIGLLVVLLLGGFWVSAIMEDTHEPICQILQTAAREGLTGDMEKATELVRQAQQTWKRHWRRTAAIADHTPMDEIDSLFAQAEIYAQVGNRQDFSALCARLSKQINAVSDAHHMTWWNLLLCPLPNPK